MNSGISAKKKGKGLGMDSSRQRYKTNN
jgi:hypothetical protein